MTSYYRCPDCDGVYTDHAPHCAGCHQTFGSPSADEAHRRSAGCLPPAGVRRRDKTFRFRCTPRVASIDGRRVAYLVWVLATKADADGVPRGWNGQALPPGRHAPPPAPGG